MIRRLLPRTWPAACRRAMPWVLALLCAPVLAQGSLSLAVSRTPLSLPVFVAEAEGHFADEGLKVQVTDCVGGHRCLRLMLDGGADVATAGDVPIMFSAFTSNDFAVVGTVSSTAQDLKLVARTDVGVSSPRALGGRKVGVVVGTSSQYFLDSVLMVHGVDPRSVVTVPLQPETMQAALEAKQVDAVSVWEPYGYRMLGAMKGSAQVLSGTGVYNGAFNLVAHRRLVGLRDPDLVRLLRAVERAERFIRDEPERAKAILKRRLGTDDEFIRFVWPQLVFRLSLDQSLLKTLESEARWALREGHVNARTAPNFLPFIHRGPLMQVQPSAVGVSR